MTEQRRDRKFFRVYYHDLASEFPEVWDTPVLYWTWSRLLAVAESMWPAVPDVPRVTKPSAVRRLVELGLVLDCPPHGYRIRGLNAERIRRSAHARNAASTRWSNAPGNAPSSAEIMPIRDETRRDEDSPPPQVGSRKDGTNPRALGTNPRAKGTAPRQEREARKRGPMPEGIASILARAAANGKNP